tara:strand:+ start:3449 stop:4651 length:1203 start_codon:yes stop_codon:yes gene_type:complete
MKKGQDTGFTVYWLIAIIALFLLGYVILLPEGEKEKLVNDPGDLGNEVDYETTYGTRGTSTRPSLKPTQETLLLSETPGKLLPYGQSLFVKSLASINLFAEENKREERITNSVSLKSNLFAGSETTKFTFRLEDPKSITKIQLLGLIQVNKGEIIVKVNNKEVFKGRLTTSELPLLIPRGYLQKTNTISFAVPSGAMGKNTYQLKDISLFITGQNVHTQEFRDLVLSRSQLQDLDNLALYYFVNCFTLREKGTLRIYLNGNLLSQQLIVCDAGEISQDIPLSQLIEGRNILEFVIDKGKYILEQVGIEGNTGTGRVPTYFFTLQIADVATRQPIGVDMKFYDTRDRKVGSLLINGFEYYIDTRSNGAYFDITPYVTEGQNVLKIIPRTELDIIDLAVFIG